MGFGGVEGANPREKDSAEDLAERLDVGRGLWDPNLG